MAKYLFYKINLSYSSVRSLATKFINLSKKDEEATRNRQVGGAMKLLIRIFFKPLLWILEVVKFILFLCLILKSISIFVSAISYSRVGDPYKTQVRGIMFECWAG